MNKKISGTFIIYMGSRQAIYPDIAASRSNFFSSSVTKFPREGPCPRKFCSPGRIKDFVQDFTKDFTKDFDKDFTNDFTNDFTKDFNKDLSRA